MDKMAAAALRHYIHLTTMQQRSLTITTIVTANLSDIVSLGLCYLSLAYNSLSTKVSIFHVGVGWGPFTGSSFSQQLYY